MSKHKTVSVSILRFYLYSIHKFYGQRVLFREKRMRIIIGPATIINNTDIKRKINFIILNKIISYYTYRKLTEACHTNARSKKRIGIIGKTSTIESNRA